MASRWRVWDMEFKDGILPNGEIVLSKDKYPEFKRTDQSNGPPVSIPGSLLDIIEMNSKNRMKEEVIIVSDSVSGAEYSYTRDGVLTLNTQVSCLFLNLFTCLFICLLVCLFVYL